MVLNADTFSMLADGTPSPQNAKLLRRRVLRSRRTPLHQDGDT